MARKSLISTRRLRRFVRKGFRLRPLPRYFKQYRGALGSESYAIWRFPWQGGNTATSQPPNWDPNFDDLSLVTYPCAIATFQLLYNQCFDFTRIRPQADDYQNDTADTLTRTINRRYKYIILYGAYLTFNVSYNPFCFYFDTALGNTTSTINMNHIVSPMIIEICLFKAKYIYSNTGQQPAYTNINNSITPPYAAAYINPFPTPPTNASDNDTTYITERMNHAYINPHDLHSDRLPQQKKIWRLLRRRTHMFKIPTGVNILYGPGENVTTNPATPAIDLLKASGWMASKAFRFKLYRNSKIEIPQALTANTISDTGTQSTFGTLPFTNLNQRYFFTFRVCRTQIARQRITLPGNFGNIDSTALAAYQRQFLPSITYTLKTYHQQDL